MVFYKRVNGITTIELGDDEVDALLTALEELCFTFQNSNEPRHVFIRALENSLRFQKDEGPG
jgi:hypothetical protein